ncbi:MAG: hypothetical protein H0X73_10935 [Chthoniobacterales bacterium]|nr:hypothetical protein [Chthoniobacterales bacterium]
MIYLIATSDGQTLQALATTLLANVVALQRLAHAVMASPTGRRNRAIAVSPMTDRQR